MFPHNSGSALFSRDTLLAVGVTLVFLGIVLRGFARASRRAQALRKQERLEARESSLPGPEDAPSWLERNFGWVANGVLAAGVAISLAGLLGR